MVEEREGGKGTIQNSLRVVKANGMNAVFVKKASVWLLAISKTEEKLSFLRK